MRGDLWGWDYLTNRPGRQENCVAQQPGRRQATLPDDRPELPLVRVSPIGETAALHGSAETGAVSVGRSDSDHLLLLSTVGARPVDRRASLC
jgi:hypothetical protein